MVEFNRTQESEPASQGSSIKICVAGVGSGGLNVLDRISLDRMMEARVVSMHTDVRVLGHSMSPSKIQLGADIMRGIGSGGDPELGREAALSSREQIQAALQGHDMVFICCGLGGGTGSGAAPVVASIARRLGAMVFVFATMPFSFEGRRRLAQAEAALEELRKSSDALILFENNRMGELILPKEGIQKAFSQADQLIGHSVRAIATMVTQPGIVRMGLADLMTALSNPDSRCLFGFGEARGNNRGTEALKRALKSPLVNQGLLLQNARNLLVHVAGGESLTLSEVEALMKQLGKHVPDRTQIMFGLAVDPRMGDSIALTLISSLSLQEISADSTLVLRQEVAPSKAEERLYKTEPAVEIEAPTPAPVAVAAPEVAVEGEEVENMLLEEEPVQAPAPAPTPAPTVVPSLLIEEPVSAPKVRVKAAAVPAATDLIDQADLFNGTVSESPKHSVTSQVEAEVPIEEPVIAAPQIRVQLRQEPVAPEPAVEPEAAVETPAPQEVHIPSPAPEAPAPTPAKSIFSVLDDNADDDEDDDDEEEDADEEVNNSHWAEKYIQQAQPKPVTQTVVASRREPEPVIASKVAAGAGSNGFKQPNLNLNKEESGRFKGTDKTFVEGEDLDVPTWMRLKQKSSK